MCYYWKCDGEDLIFIDVYIDDLLATGTKQQQSIVFESIMLLSINDLCQVSKFSGCGSSSTTDGGYALDQKKVIGYLLRTNGLVNANSTRALIGDNCCNSQPDAAWFVERTCWLNDPQFSVSRENFVADCILHASQHHIRGA